MSTPEKMSAVGLAMPFPAISGAEPCTASKTAYSSPMFGPRHEPEPPHEPRRQIGNDVAVEVREKQHVELGGVHHELNREVVNDQF